MEVFEIRDHQTRICRNCGREVLKGEKVARSTNHDHYRNIPSKGRPGFDTPYLCRDCYTYPNGDRIIT